MNGVGGRVELPNKMFVTFDNTHLFVIEIRLSKFDLFQISALKKRSKQFVSQVNLFQFDMRKGWFELLSQLFSAPSPSRIYLFLVLGK